MSKEQTKSVVTAFMMTFDIDFIKYHNHFFSFVLANQVHQALDQSTSRKGAFILGVCNWVRRRHCLDFLWQFFYPRAFSLQV
jgi:hypothetical protein